MYLPADCRRGLRRPPNYIIKNFTNMSANDMFQSFLSEVLEPAIARAVTKAVQETIFDQNKDRIDVATAAKILNVSKKTIYRYCKEGPEETRLHYTQANGKIQLFRTEVEKYSRKPHAIRIKPFGRK